jgi:signal transduction histidine kinase
MASVSKRFGEKGIGSFKKSFQLSLFRLTLFYTAIAAVILLISSSITYSAFSQRLENRYQNFRVFLNGYPVNLPRPPQADEVRSDLIQALIVVNGLLLIAAGFGSYFLAKWNLAPIQESYERQQRFLGDASHELRTPLAIVHAELENELALADGSRRASALSKMEEVQRMNAIVSDLLTISRLDESAETGFQTEEVDISHLIHHTVERLSPLAEKQGVSLQVNLPEKNIIIPSNPMLVQQVLTNTIKNAILYNKPQGTVTVSAVVRSRAIEIVVTDTGVGIDSAHLENIFERFYRVDSSRVRATGGSGLGLSIVQSAVSRLHGSITVTSELGTGTEITISLPSKFTS